MELYIPLCVTGRIKKLIDKLLHYLRRYPSSAEPDGYFGSRQRLRLHLFKSLNIDRIFRLISHRSSCNFKFFPDIAGKILVRYQVFVLIMRIALVQRIQIDYAFEFVVNLLFGFACQLTHIVHIDLCFFSHRNGEHFGSCIYRGHGFVCSDGTLIENIRLAFKVALIVEHL